MLRLLLIDNESSFVNSLKDRLVYEDYTVEYADGLIHGKELLRKSEFDVLICDLRCFETITAKGDATEWFKGPIIVMTNPEACRTAVEMIKKGAYDVIKRRPCDLNQLIASLKECTNRTSDSLPPAKAAASAIRTSTVRVSKPIISKVDDMIGQSKNIEIVKSIINKVAPSDARVLITGENGTGKELVARWLHEKSNRNGMPFVEINCAAIPSELIESELFGHEKGAFTSAVRQRKGRFEQANGGTLFLDEIGDMSLPAQAKVLRVLQESKLSRVGSDSDIVVDVRVVAATNKNLREEIANGHFREDLYHRLSVICIHVPALCERKDDIPVLVAHFMEKISANYGVAPLPVEPAAMAELVKKDWTGNIRELRNVVERLLILCDNKVTAKDVLMYAREGIENTN